MGDDEHPVEDAKHITRTHELPTHAARRARDRPAYIAWALAARLGIATVDLPRLALCRRPRPDQWAEDLAQIASRFDLALEPLARLLRAVEAPGGPQHHPPA